MKMTTLPLRNLLNRSPVRALLLIALSIICFARSPQARAVCQQGCDLTSGNTFLGDDALANNVGALDTAVGGSALRNNTTGSNNTAIGYQALNSNTTGIGNTAVGFRSLFTTTGSFNIAVGNGAGGNLTTGSNNIDIGNTGVAAESKTIRIGHAGIQTNTYIAGINGVVVASGVGVIVDPRGHLGTITSSERFKESIKPIDKASEVIFSLQPVTFYYKKDLDPDAVPQFGLVAEQVERVNPDLVARDDQGKPYSVRYEAVNAMLLNEFLKARRQIDAQQKQIEALTAGLQKVSAQLELSKSAPQAAFNSQ
jgi:Chaperone of endosialidase